MRFARDLNKQAKFRHGDALEIAGTSLTAGEAGVVLVIGGLILGSVGAGLMLLFRTLYGNKKAAR